MRTIASRPVFMNDNDRPQRSRAIYDHLQAEGYRSSCEECSRLDGELHEMIPTLKYSEVCIPSVETCPMDTLY